MNEMSPERPSSSQSFKPLENRCCASRRASERPTVITEPNFGGATEAAANRQASADHDGTLASLACQSPGGLSQASVDTAEAHEVADALVGPIDDNEQSSESSGATSWRTKLSVMLQEPTSSTPALVCGGYSCSDPPSLPHHVPRIPPYMLPHRT